MSIVVRNRAGGRYGQSAPWSRRVRFAQLARSGGMSAAGQAASDFLRATAARFRRYLSEPDVTIWSDAGFRRMYVAVVSKGSWP